MSTTPPLSRPTSTTTTTNTLLGSPKDEGRTMTPDDPHRYDENTDGLPQHSVTRQANLLRRFNYKALHTSPSFFSINMGTGIASILLHNFPYRAFWLEILGVIVFILNVVIFVVLLFLTIYRYIKYKNSWRITLDHKTASMFWGCFPMGFVTIVNMVAFVCVPAWGKHWAQLALGLWWMDIVVAVIVNLGMVFVMFTMQTHLPDEIAPTLLLPVVSTVVAAASGSVVAQSMLAYNPALGRSTLYASFVIWGTGVPLALMMITIIMYKTISVGPPKLGAVMSSFLPLGPCGQGSYGIVSMGITARKVVYEYNTPMIPKMSMDQNRIIADAMYGACLVASLVLWGLALCFYLLAFSQVLFTLRRNWKWLGPNKFHAGMWGITFPIGVWATASITLADELSSPAFKVVAAFLSTQVILHWLYVSVLTVWTSIDGRFFRSPEILESEGIVERLFWHSKNGGLTRQISRQDLEAGVTTSKTSNLVKRREPEDHLDVHVPLS